MKSSKRNSANQKSDSFKKKEGKPQQSKYFLKGGPYKYGEDQEANRVKRIRGF